jgi:hypothetical protein
VEEECCEWRVEEEWWGGLWGVELECWTVVVGFGWAWMYVHVLGACLEGDGWVGGACACTCVSSVCLCNCVCGLKCARGVYSECGRAAWCVLRRRRIIAAYVCKERRPQCVLVCMRVVAGCSGCVLVVATCLTADGLVW